MAIAFLVAGTVLIGAGSFALLAGISVQIVFDPFHRVMSVFLTRVELGAMLLIVGAWVGWTGRQLWREKRAGYRYGIGILAVIFLRGLLALLPPLERSEWIVGGALMVLSLAGIVLLWYARPALQAK